MTAVDWEEVKRLAADFQRAQLTSTSQVLSERNCVEIITKLIESNLLEVIFTTDGREYITPQYLLKEIKDELYVSRGRINLVELAKTLNVDLSHITARIPEIEKSSGCSIIMGQLINKNYQRTIAEEINERLQRDGQITTADLTKLYDLPGDFLQSVLERNLGKIIKAKQDKSDSRVFFTQAFIEKCKGIVKGALRALTRPTQVSAILEATDLQERDFYYAYDCLVEDKQTFGSLTARQGNATFIPQMYTKQQSDWVQNFYKQNGYLEYDALTRLGISDPVSFVRRNYSDLLHLPTCAVGSLLIDQIEAAVEDAISSNSFVDLMMIVPSIFSPDDVAKVLEAVMKRSKGKSAPLIFSDTVLISEGFVQEVLKPFTDKGIIQKKAQQAINDGSYIQLQMEKKLGRSLGKEKMDDNFDSKADKKEERRKKAGSGKSGGGTQGRETKTKAAPKKKGRSRKESGGSENEVIDKKLEFFTPEEVEGELSSNKNLEELEDSGVLTDFARHITPLLNKTTYETTARLFEETLVSGASQRRKAHVELENKLENWLLELKLTERSIKLFPFADTQSRLTASVLRMVGTEVVNAIFSYATSADGSSPVDPKQITAEMRTKLLADVNGDLHDALASLHKTLYGNSLEEFISSAEAALSLTGLLGRKSDKKKEKQFIHKRREYLLSELSIETTPALVLQLATLTLFQAATGHILQVSGKFVPTILAFLKPHLTDEENAILQAYQDKLLKLLSVDSEEMEAELKTILSEEMPKIKELATTYKKMIQKDN
ncbi:unnamed protein product [Nezara viridula]|uniref:E3 UFM1-protein ligase 1 homolog n=1 Tax=Nezara viridula TaxID=85310 RepID=A0A9P0H1A9_NEZVI|nr:unnamed protein product [Nezara viridula]